MCFTLGCNKNKSNDENVTQLVLPDASQLNAVNCLPDGSLFAFGGMKFERSDFYSSQDNGNSWDVFHHPPNGNKGLYASCLVGSNLWAAGFDGKIFFKNTSDSTWVFQQTAYFLYTFSAIAYRDGTALIAGNMSYNFGLLLRVDTLGNILQIDSFPFAINDVIFVDNGKAYAVGYGAVLKSIDTGKSWAQLDITDDNYMAIAAKNANDIYTVGYEGTIVHIYNDGNAFDKIRNGQNPIGIKERYRDIAFKEDFGVIVGDKGLVRISRDGGKNWEPKKSLTKNELRAVAVSPIGDFFVTVGTFGSAFRVNF